MANASESPYTLLRESACCERIFYLYHRLGIQSNVVVAAKYANSHSKLLTRPAVLSALKVVVEAHPMMRVVGVARPSEKNKNKNKLYLAMLHEINLETCVELVNTPTDGSSATSMIERAHNEWEHTSDSPDRPLFKLIIVNQEDVILVYHHMMADGLSGYVFHREFLGALNEGARVQDNNYIVRSDPSNTQIPLEWSQMPNATKSRHRLWHPSTRQIITSQCMFLMSQVLLGSRTLFSKLPRSRPHPRSVHEVADAPNRIVTNVVSNRFTAAQVSKILKACRAHGTTFTPLLVTILLVTMASEYNKDAYIGSTRFALDMRPHLPIGMDTIGCGTEGGVMFNCTSGMARSNRLARYRDILQEVSVGTPEGEKVAYTLDDDKVWAATRRYKQWMNESIPIAVQAVRSSKGMNSDLEHVLDRIMPFAGMVLTQTSLVSNVGVFNPGDADVVGNGADKWSVVDMHFSAGATNGAQGSQGPIFNVSGLKGGDSIINAVFEEGIISREAVQRILDSTVAKIISMAP